MCALSGERGLITDFGLHETVALLDREGLLDAFHFVVDRGRRPRQRPGLPDHGGPAHGVLRRHRVVYVDAHAGRASPRSSSAGAPASCPADAARSRAARPSTRARHGRVVRPALQHAPNALRYYIFGTWPE